MKEGQGIFGLLGSPRDRVRDMLTRDLEFRRNDPRSAERWAGFHYKGGADLVLQHGQFWSGRQLPVQYEERVGQPQRCFENALYACEADRTLTYCEGYVTSGFGEPLLHGWCVDDDGVVEVTMPTDAATLHHGRARRTHMSMLPPERWGYFGVQFTTELVRAHGDSPNPLSTTTTRSVPLLDRGLSEVALNGDETDMTEVHDFPLVKVPYKRYRRTMP
jgi:hypothetical protein